MKTNKIKRMDKEGNERVVVYSRNFAPEGDRKMSMASVNMMFNAELDKLRDKGGDWHIEVMLITDEGNFFKTPMKVSELHGYVKLEHKSTQYEEIIDEKANFDSDPQLKCIRGIRFNISDVPLIK